MHTVEQALLEYCSPERLFVGMRRYVTTSRMTPQFQERDSSVFSVELERSR